jgi:hypothetical protein
VLVFSEFIKINSPNLKQNMKFTIILTKKLCAHNFLTLFTSENAVVLDKNLLDSQHEANALNWQLSQ